MNWKSRQKCFQIHTRLQMRLTTLSRLGCSTGYDNTPRKLIYSWKVDCRITWTVFTKPNKLRGPTFNLPQKLPLSNLLVIPLTTSSEAHSFSFIFNLLQKYCKKQKWFFFLPEVFPAPPVNVSVTQQNLTLILMYLKAFPLFSEYCVFFWVLNLFQQHACDHYIKCLYFYHTSVLKIHSLSAGAIGIFMTWYGLFLCLI